MWRSPARRSRCKPKKQVLSFHVSSCVYWVWVWSKPWVSLDTQPLAAKKVKPLDWLSCTYFFSKTIWIWGAILLALRAEGMTVLWVRSGKDVNLSALQPQPDGVLLDLGLLA